MKHRSESNDNLCKGHHSWTNPYMSRSLCALIYTDTEVTLLKFTKPGQVMQCWNLCCCSENTQGKSKYCYMLTQDKINLSCHKFIFYGCIWFRATLPAGANLCCSFAVSRSLCWSTWPGIRAVAKCSFVFSLQGPPGPPGPPGLPTRELTGVPPDKHKVTERVFFWNKKGAKSSALSKLKYCTNVL